MENEKYDELEDIVYENTILIKKNRALVSINHDNLHGAYRESYDVTRELLLLQLDRIRRFINDTTSQSDLFDYIKKRIEVNKKTAEVTETIIKSNDLMMDAIEASREVNQELVDYLSNTFKKIQSGKKSKKGNLKDEKKINELFAMQKENIIKIFRNNSKINQNRRKIQKKIEEVEIISHKAQEIVANFHQILYKNK